MPKTTPCNTAPYADLLAVLDGEIAMRKSLTGAAKAQDLIAARADVAALIAREKKQRAVLEALCASYIANRHAIGTHDFVTCITAGGRCADTSIGKVWLRANALACEPYRSEPTNDCPPLVTVSLSATVRNDYTARNAFQPNASEGPALPAGEQVRVPLGTARSLLDDALRQCDRLRSQHEMPAGTRRAYQALIRQLQNAFVQVGAQS